MVPPILDRRVTVVGSGVGRSDVEIEGVEEGVEGEEVEVEEVGEVGVEEQGDPFFFSFPSYLYITQIRLCLLRNLY